MAPVQIEQTRAMVEPTVEQTRVLSTDAEHGEPRQEIEDSPEPDEDEGAED